MRASQLAVFGTLLVVTAASYVSPGPRMLDDCPCGDIYKTMARCQSAGNNNVRECVCIPNPNGWYSWIHNCRACLTGNVFFENLGSTMTQLMTSCTQNGGGISSDGESICASNSGFEYCAGFQDRSSGKSSWSSFEQYTGNRERRNGTQWLDIEVPRNGNSNNNNGKATTTAHRDDAEHTGSATATGRGATKTGQPSSTEPNWGALESVIAESGGQSSRHAAGAMVLGIALGVGAAFL